MHEFRRFLRSTARFVWAVTKRSVYGLFFLFLRWTDLYTSVIRDRIRESWRENADWLMGYLDTGALWIAITIVVSSVIWTYWEVDRELRDPKVTSKLKSFYLVLGEMISRKISNNDEFESLKNDQLAAKAEVLAWIGNNMDAASNARLRQYSRSGFGIFTTRRDDAYNDEHSTLVDKMIGQQEQIALLIERMAWV